MKAFADLPLYLQHNTVSKLYILEGAYLNSKGDCCGALRAYQKVAEIGYAVRGNISFEYYMDLWRIVGAAMAYDEVDLAHLQLERIWKSLQCGKLSSNDTKAAFFDLTLKYSMPWWQDTFDYSKQRRLEALLMDVCRETKANSVKSVQRRKKGHKKKSK